MTESSRVVGIAALTCGLLLVGSACGDDDGADAAAGAAGASTGGSGASTGGTGAATGGAGGVGGEPSEDAAPPAGGSAGAVADAQSPRSTANWLYSFDFENPAAPLDTPLSKEQLEDFFFLKFSRHEGESRIVTDHNRTPGGGRAWRWDIGPGFGVCSNVSICRGDEVGLSSIREEVYPTGRTHEGTQSNCMRGAEGCPIPDGKVVFTVWSEYLEYMTFTGGTSASVLFFQHQQDGSGPTMCDNANQPYLALYHGANGNESIVRRKWGTQTKGVSPGGVCLSDPGPYDKSKVFASWPTSDNQVLGSTVLGQWVDHCVRMEYDVDPGEARLTYSRRLPAQSMAWTEVYDDSTAPHGFEVFPDGSYKWTNRQKLGAYHWHAGVGLSARGYIDDFRVSKVLDDGTGSCDEFSPSGPPPAP